jgi:hypothetical protein
VSIDEIIVRCFGRSLHTYKISNKPIQQGYKVFGLADHGCLYSFLWSSRVRGLQEIVLRPQLTPTGSLVRTLALTLPRCRITIYMDNYFTPVPLFEELRSCEFGAVGTTRPHSVSPSEMKELKDRFSSYRTRPVWLGRITILSLLLQMSTQFIQPKIGLVVYESGLQRRLRMAPSYGRSLKALQKRSDGVPENLAIECLKYRL